MAVSPTAAVTGTEAAATIVVESSRLPVSRTAETERVVFPHRLGSHLAVGETVVLPHPPLPLVDVSIEVWRGRQQNDSLADG